MCQSVLTIILSSKYLILNTYFLFFFSVHLNFLGIHVILANFRIELPW